MRIFQIIGLKIRSGKAIMLLQKIIIFFNSKIEVKLSNLELLIKALRGALDNQ